MKKLTGILMAVCLTAALIAGCGQKAGRENTQTTGNQSAAQTESQTAGNQRETGDLSGDEVSAAQHCILLAGKNGHVFPIILRAIFTRDTDCGAGGEKSSME